MSPLGKQFREDLLVGLKDVPKALAIKLAACTDILIIVACVFTQDQIADKFMQRLLGVVWASRCNGWGRRLIREGYRYLPTLCFKGFELCCQLNGIRIWEANYVLSARNY